MPASGGVFGSRPERRRKFVEIDYRTTAEGLVTPLAIYWDDGRRFKVDRVLDRMPAAAERSGGAGMRYTVEIAGRRTYLFYDPHNRAWFVEAKRRPGEDW